MATSAKRPGPSEFDGRGPFPSTLYTLISASDKARFERRNGEPADDPQADVEEAPLLPFNQPE